VPDEDWVIVTVCPATLSVPIRSTPVVFAVTLKVTEPIPDPVAPVVIVIHWYVVVALHEHCVPAITLNVRLAASEPIAKLVGETLPVQPTESCVTDTVWPATVIVAVRGAPVGLAGTLIVTDPIPEPAAPLTMVIQLAVVVAVHEHAVPLMMLIVRVPAVEATVNDVGVTLYEHCASADDTSAAQISAMSAQHRAVFMIASSENGVHPRPSGDS